MPGSPRRARSPGRPLRPAGARAGLGAKRESAPGRRRAAVRAAGCQPNDSTNRARTGEVPFVRGRSPGGPRAAGRGRRDRLSTHTTGADLGAARPRAAGPRARILRSASLGAARPQAAGPDQAGRTCRPAKCGPAAGGGPRARGGAVLRAAAWYSGRTRTGRGRRGGTTLVGRAGASGSRGRLRGAPDARRPGRRARKRTPCPPARTPEERSRPIGPPPAAAA